MIHLLAVIMLLSLLIILPETLALWEWLKIDLILVFGRIGQLVSVTGLVWLSWLLAKVETHDTEQLNYISHMAPSVGLIGTVAGLVAILMADHSSSIRPDMGSALLTTLAGAAIFVLASTKLRSGQQA